MNTKIPEYIKSLKKRYRTGSTSVEFYVLTEFKSKYGLNKKDSLQFINNEITWTELKKRI